MSELDPRGFELGLLVEGVERLIATVARLLESPKRCGHIAAVFEVFGTQQSSVGCMWELR